MQLTMRCGNQSTVQQKEHAIGRNQAIPGTFAIRAAKAVSRLACPPTNIAPCRSLDLGGAWEGIRLHLTFCEVWNARQAVNEGVRCISHFAKGEMNPTTLPYGVAGMRRRLKSSRPQQGQATRNRSRLAFTVLSGSRTRSQRSGSRSRARRGGGTWRMVRRENRFAAGLSLFLPSCLPDQRHHSAARHCATP